MTQGEASKRGWVPAAPFKPLLQERLDAMGEALSMKESLGWRSDEVLAERLGITYEGLGGIMRHDWVDFDTADRIILVCTGSAEGWFSTPELREIYESFNLEPLDVMRPSGTEGSRVHAFFEEGLTVEEIRRRTNIGRRTLTAYRDAMGFAVAA